MDDLIRITDLTRHLGLSSRSLRYYEEAGLIVSVRSGFEKYRYYDGANVERLRQIIVLRKMQIPVKDIIRIYESEDMSVVVATFMERIRAIDEEVGALTELRHVVNDFLQAMAENGITKISALPILYEKMERRIDTLERKKPMNYEALSALSERLARPDGPSIVALPVMRVLTSRRRADGISDPEGFWRWVQMHGLAPGEPGAHERFEYREGADDITMLRIAAGFENESPYLDDSFSGGLFAAANVYLDEDIGGRFRSLIAEFDDNAYYEIDYLPGGRLRHEALLEDMISPDGRREMVALFVPVKKRLPDPALFGRPREIAPDAITVEEIEEANPILWTQEVRMDRLIPINSPHYRVTGAGEAEFVSWIGTRVLSTNVAVRLPFRVDIQFRIGEESGGWGHGRKEESIRFHHGDDLNYLFGINMLNSPDPRLSQEAICFHQPIFGDLYSYPGRGGIRPGVYNSLTWIVGKAHFAVIVNGEVRYCGEDFPYMKENLTREPPRPIILGSDSSVYKYFRRVEVSQLAQPARPKIKEGMLSMVIRQSNNQIPNIHRLITGEHGENYWFNGCARYLMESAGAYEKEPDFGYWFFAGLTGDVLAQVYSYGEYVGEAVSSAMFRHEGGRYFERIFERCGYAGTYVSGEQLRANREMYLQTLIAYIDKGMPVMAVTWDEQRWGVYVGYEAYGKTLLYLTGNKSKPVRVPIEKVFADDPGEGKSAMGWLFLGERKRAIDLAQAYRDVILDMPRLLTFRTEAFCLGPQAFSAWADGIEAGRLDGMTPDEFGDGWCEHKSYICNMATNGSCAGMFLDRALALNPDMTFLADVMAQYRRTAELWNKDGGKDLEALGGGFNATLIGLQDRARRTGIAQKIREAAACMDRVLAILREAGL